MRKKVDSRVRTIVENGIKTKTRALFVIVGDHGRDQVVNLHYMLSKITSKKPSVLWCYKKELGFSSHRKKRMKQVKDKIKQGLHDPNVDDPFEMFISATNIRYCYYKDTEQVLGKTFGMCILQDFEALTPNLLCRTIETVEGGGIVVLLLKTMTSLKQLYDLSMDAHAQLRTETHTDTEPRFNERLVLSLRECPACLVADDELNILPLSSTVVGLKPVDTHDLVEGDDGAPKTAREIELDELKATVADTQPIGSIVSVARTLDQAKAVMSFVDAISEKSLNQTMALTAGRGRGKSAALGLAIASAIAYGYSNIFVTAPSPEPGSAPGPCEWCRLPDTPGHAASCALRPGQCRYCQQRLAVAVLAPHEEACRRRCSAQRGPQRRQGGPARAPGRPPSTPRGTCSPSAAEGPAGEPACTSARQLEGALPPLSLRPRPPAVPVPLPKSTSRERPGGRPVQRPRSREMGQQTRPPVFAEALHDEVSTDEVPTLEELKQQVQRERDAYIKWRSADQVLCHGNTKPAAQITFASS